MYGISSGCLSSHDESRHSIAAQAKERSVAAGVFPRVIKVLESHTAVEILATGCSVIHAVASGGAFPETEARRDLAACGIESVLRAMEIAPDSSAVFHWGLSALGVMVAWSGTRDHLAAYQARANRIILDSPGAAAAIIDGVMRYGDHPSDHGRTSHTIKIPGSTCVMEVSLPGSILSLGVSFISTLTTAGHGEDRMQNEMVVGPRRKALNDAGALKVIAKAIRAQPSFPKPGEPNVDMVQGQPKNLGQSHSFFHRAITGLVPHDAFAICAAMDFKPDAMKVLQAEIGLNDADMAVVFGDSEAPGFIVMDYFTKSTNGSLGDPLEVLG
jgi:hypothetical protein